MFGFVANCLASIASFLFPLYASYKALKTSDPSQLTPWLMYWSVLSCILLVEAWTEFILVWIPFYSWMRLGFLLWLVLPSTQGARVLYEGYLHPYLEENELAIEEFIAKAHDRFKAEGMRYLQQVIELIRTRVFNLPPSAPPQESTKAVAAPQGFMQSLLSRFTVPVSQQGSRNTWPISFDYNGLAASAFSSTTGSFPTTFKRNMDATIDGTPMPEDFAETPAGFAHLAEQRERLVAMLSALDSTAAELQKKDKRNLTDHLKTIGGLLDQQGQPEPPSEHGAWGMLSKSRSEVDFEKIDAPSASEEDAGLRRRGYDEGDAGATKGWMNMFGWSAANNQTQGQSSGFQKE